MRGAVWVCCGERRMGWFLREKGREGGGGGEAGGGDMGGRREGRKGGGRGREMEWGWRE